MSKVLGPILGIALGAALAFGLWQLIDQIAK